MKKILSILLLISGFSYSQQIGTLLKPSAINGYTTNGKVLITKSTGTMTGVPDWQTKVDFLHNTVKSNTLTPTYLPKAIGSDSLSNSQVYDDGTNVGIGTSTPIVKLHVDGDIFTTGGTRSGSVAFGTYTFWGSATNEITTYKSATGNDLKLQELGGGDVLMPHSSSKLNIANLTASRLVGTDASKNLSSIVLGNGLSLSSGTLSATNTSSTTILTASTNITISGTAPNYTISTPTQTTGLLVASNNLSDLSNPLTARNNLKEWDLYLTGGDQSTTSNVASNITDLVTHTLEINKRYYIHGTLHIGCNNTGGVKFQVTLPTGATVYLVAEGLAGGGTTRTFSAITASATLTAAAFTTVNTASSYIVFSGEILMGGTAGTVQFGFASGTNTQTSTVYQLGSHLTIKQIN